MNKKILIVVCSMAILSACGNINSNDQGSSTAAQKPTDVKEMKTEKANERVDVVASPNNDIKLYPLNKKDGTYNGFILEANGQKKEFDWKSSALIEDKPQVISSDLTNDGNPEAVVLLSQGRGTGLHMEEAHVVDLSNFSEINIEDPEEIISKNVKSEIKNKGKHTEVIVKVKDKSTNLQYSNVSNTMNLKEVGFGAVNYYSVDKGNLIFKTDGTIGAEQYVGKIEVTYAYDKEQNKLEAKTTKFIPEAE
ncbi:hypothetical protein [Paenibacillus sp. Z6-24]